MTTEHIMAVVTILPCKTESQFDPWLYMITTNLVMCHWPKGITGNLLEGVQGRATKLLDGSRHGELVL